ncbi:uncharacterized protein BO95DRAFT_464624 [Aspergillus brunneoviolaceus CBS 621.78]|uniref:Uncharacterized protein n=1 Tax=Aspergillus brunneoviolaceus CBS 621.78 TaxID=1450534 RepID=A0ACD1G6J9_9EURO|nr:hypothetical protein BO95DRAFT_464624 [Aspergillus brunneoviolaceus CBS 621.78]RAH44845.1 hypothetical protein BO95DRAFT_464624 [Aspergillus brunneoviolaceus CBS 621.78]
MAYPLLPVGATGAVYVRKHYPALLKDIIRDCTDSINALNLFNELVSAPDGIAPDSPGFKEFDAHGGDMACHIRAGMLHELYDKHRAYFLETGHEFLGDPVVHYYMTQFETVRSRAQHACIQLTKHNTDPEKLGFERKRDTLLHVVQVLGWENEKCGGGGGGGGGGGPFEFLPTSGNSSPTTTSPGGESMSSSTGTRSSISSSAGTGASTPLHSSMSTLSLASSITPMSSPSSPPSHSACKRDPTSPTWDVHDSYTAVLFLAAASVLAKFKEFARMGSRITVRFVPQKAMDHGNELIEPYWDRSNTNYVDFKINRIKDRHCFLQKWLSLISCSWVQSWAAGLQLSDDLQRFMLESTHKSPREVSVSAAFPTYLICREIWANRQWPLLLLVRHFCEDGYHLRAYTSMATRPETRPDDSCSREAESPTSGLHRPAGWPLQRVAIEDLVADPRYRTQPYITIFGNSMQGGSHLDYLGRAFRDDGHHQADVPYHADEAGQPVCARQAAHDRAFQAHDHDLLAKCLLADHTQFPFEAPPRPDQRAGPVEGVARVSRAIEALRDRYAAQVNALGGGPANIDVYCWEHVFAETPARVAAEVQAKVAAGDLNLFF